MKKILILLSVLFSVCAYSQTNYTQFPKVGTITDTSRLLAHGDKFTGMLQTISLGQFKKWVGTIIDSGIYVTDGDKGDIIISDTGKIYIIDLKAVANSNLDGMPSNTIKGNISSNGTSPQDLTVSQAQALLEIPEQVNLSAGTNITIVGSYPNYTISAAGSNIDTTSLSNRINLKENIITAGTTLQYWRGDKSWQTLNSSAVGLGNLTNNAQLKIASNLSDLNNASTARTNLGATTIGSNMFTLTNPSAVTFPRFNADNTVTARTAAELASDLGGVTGTPGGNDTEVQFNDAGVFQGDAGFTYNKTTNVASISTVRISDGSVSAPGLAFSSATNTGFYSDGFAVDGLYVSAQGSAVMNFRNNGTYLMSGFYPLTDNSINLGAWNVRFADIFPYRIRNYVGSAATPSYSFDDGIGNSFNGGIFGGGSAASNFLGFSTSGTERMRIASNGAINFAAYGSGAITGTGTYYLAVDASGNIIETSSTSGEANTASNLGGGLANYSTKVGVDLRFNSFSSADFDLASNLITIDGTKWATLASPTFTGTVVLPSTTSIGTITQTELSYIDGLTSSAQTQIDAKVTGSISSNQVAYGSGSSIVGSAAFTFDGTDVSVTNNITVGKIGIGVASSNWALDIKATGFQIDGNFYSNFRAVNNTPDRGFYFGYDNTVAGSGIIASNADYLGFWTFNGSAWGERMRITPTGTIGINNASPSASSIVDIVSTTKGFLPPRMTTAQRDAISTPAEGLMIFDTDQNEPSVYNGSSWVYLSSGSSGETNTASNLGGGLANYSTKVGVDLRFNSFDAADFDLASNLISIDPTKWATLASPTFTGTVSGITATMVGLGNVTNNAQLVSSTSSTQDGYFGTIKLKDVTNPSHYLTVRNNEDLSADRILSIILNDANRTLTITASASIEGTNTGDNAVNSLYSGLVSNATHTGDATGATALTVVGINGTLLSSLGTGILKNTTGTGVPSIAVAGDFPTLNQNTTGSAATLTTARAIYGNNFDGSAALTQIIASTYGGTGNGFTKFSGPATTEKTFTLPNASATILTDNSLVTVAQGGTGASTLTGALVGNGTGAITGSNVSLTELNYVDGVTSGIQSQIDGKAASGANTDITSITGSAATLTTARTIYGNSFNGSDNLTQVIASTYGGTGNGFTKFSGATTTEKTYTLPDASTTILTTNYTGALATGILKNTTTTGALTIAVAGDFPTLNQNTTGSAATLTTARAIYGNNFDGSAALTQVIASTYGGTGNGFFKVSGPTTSEKTFTLPNASATVLTDNAAVTVAQGGTGASTLTGILVGNGTGAVTAITGTANQVLRRNAGNTAYEFAAPSGGSDYSVTSISGGNYTATITTGSELIYATESTSRTINLPTAVGNTATFIIVLDSATDGVTLTVEGSGSETISGDLNIVLRVRYESVTLRSNNSNWYIN